MTPRVRFAPSPTGRLHQGNVRTALFNFLFARHHQGHLVLRIEDTDRERSAPEFEAAIFADLQWLGLEADESPLRPGACGPYRQSERLNIYRHYLETLCAAGKAYPCFCSAEQIKAERQASLAKGKPYRYRGTCRNLSTTERQSKERQGNLPSYRFKVESGELAFQDLVYGQKAFEAASFGDFSLARADGSPLYLFACAVDDVLMNITHVIRGEDGLPNAPRQMLIHRALGFDSPQVAHLPLICGPDHAPLSKRNGSTSMAELRSRGYLPQAVLNDLALLGWSPPHPQDCFDLPALITQFDLSRVSRGSAVFDFARLDHLNRLHMARLSDAEYLHDIQPFLDAQAIDPSAFPRVDLQKTLLAMRGGVKDFCEAASWLKRVVHTPSLADPQIRHSLQTETAKTALQGCMAAIAGLDQEFSASNYDVFLDSLKDKTGLKGKALLMPLRLALTAQPTGPELAVILAALGKKRVWERIAHALENL